MKIIIAVILLLKTALLFLFSSDYQNQLFIPFVEHFLSHPSSPWEAFYLSGKIDAFPYHPFMLYLLSLFYLPYHLFLHHFPILGNFFFKLPTLLADGLIAFLLYKLFPRRIKEIVIFYLASPIIIYAAYMHSQLDLIPTAILFLSVYLLVSGRITFSALVFGLALSTKFHVLAAYPLILVYLLKNRAKTDILKYTLIPAAIYLGFSFPHIFNQAYLSMVLSNQKQNLVFDAFYHIGGLKIYLPIFLSLILYARFAVYKKVNNDLFFAFLGIVFSAFVLVIVPGPGWYLWMLPFLCIFFIKFFRQEKRLIYLYACLNALYLVYFVVFFIPDHPDLTFLNVKLDFKVMDERLRSVCFTLLETALFLTICVLYKLGVRSNSVYSREGIRVIGISGDSGAGKTILSQDISSVIKEKLLGLEGDAGHKWERDDEHWQVFNHLDPKANFIYRQAENLLNLKMGKTIYWSDYDHASGKFISKRRVSASDFVILSGLHTFYLPVMRRIIDLKIYLDTDERLRRHWKICRDIRERGYSREASIAQIEKRTEDARKYVMPQREYADMIINYFVEGDFPVGDPGIAPGMKLKVTFDSGIDVEPVMERLRAEGVGMRWNYADDLRSQYVIFDNAPSKEAIESLARELIVNKEEILSSNASWSGGLRGIAQLFVLLVFSEKIKSREGYCEI